MSPDAGTASPFDGVFGVVPVPPAVGEESVNLLATLDPDDTVLTSTKTRHAAASPIIPDKTRHSAAGTLGSDAS